MCQGAYPSQESRDIVCITRKALVAFCIHKEVGITMSTLFNSKSNHANCISMPEAYNGTYFGVSAPTRLVNEGMVSAGQSGHALLLARLVLRWGA